MRYVGRCSPTIAFCSHAPRCFVAADDTRQALHYAAGAGHVELMEVLLKRGSDVNGGTNNKTTALALCCMSGNEDAVRLLVRYRAEYVVGGEANELCVAWFGSVVTQHVARRVACCAAFSCETTWSERLSTLPPCRRMTTYVGVVPALPRQSYPLIHLAHVRRCSLPTLCKPRSENG